MSDEAANEKVTEGNVVACSRCGHPNVSLRFWERPLGLYEIFAWTVVIIGVLLFLAVISWHPGARDLRYSVRMWTIVAGAEFTSAFGRIIQSTFGELLMHAAFVLGCIYVILGHMTGTLRWPTIKFLFSIWLVTFLIRFQLANFPAEYHAFCGTVGSI